jgi:ribosomal protein L7/L12
MEMLLLVLQTMVLGMRGVRREALLAVVEELKVWKEEMEELQRMLGNAVDREDALSHQVDDLNRRLLETQEALEKAQKAEDALGSQVDDLNRRLRETQEALEKAQKDTWENPATYKLSIRRAVVAGAKIPVIKALRAVTNLGLKEAKGVMDSYCSPIDKEGSPTNEESWVVLSSNASHKRVGEALLILVVEGKLWVGGDIRIVRNPDGMY